MRTHARTARGQALVETALGVMVFVTILIFGIYFAEVGALTLKVQEAANFAMWDATGRVLHNPAERQWGRDTVAGAVERAASRRYSDFDGRQRMGGTGVATQQAIARAQPIQVGCGTALPGDVPVLRPEDAGPALAAAMNVQAQGIRCQASSRMRAARVGFFLEERRSGFFQESHRRAAAAFTVCAAGRASGGGGCNGGFAMLVDDWGLSGVAEGRACPLSIDSGRECANVDYYRWTERIYRANGGGGNAGSALAGIAGADSVNEDQFFMSFRGEEDNYEENIGATHAGGQSRWEVTPFDASNLSPKYNVRRANRFLGLPR